MLRLRQALLRKHSIIRIIQPQMVSFSSCSSSAATFPFLVHSTFRDDQGQQVKPEGLEWDMMGDSYLSFVPTQSDVDLESEPVRRGLIEAYNRWCYAKDLPFRNVQDIKSLSQSDTHHVQVQWEDETTSSPEKLYRNTNVPEMIEKDEAATGKSTPVEVWINGMYVSLLTPNTLNDILSAVSQMQSVKICLKRSRDTLRIEKYFQGMIRGYQVFDHLLDNLYALEDVEIVDECTIVGTATLPDWIMGGQLTSRLWVQEIPETGDILTLRPLRNDDIRTSDRTYRLVKGRDDEKIRIVRQELTRLRFLASLSIPLSFPLSEQETIVVPAETCEESIKRAKMQRFNRRKKFTL